MRTMSRRAQILWTLAAAVSAVFFIRVFGVPIEFAIGIGLCLGALILAVLWFMPDNESPWPPQLRTGRRPTSEVSRLSWSIAANKGEIRGTTVRLVRELIRQQLELEGIDAEDPAQLHVVDNIFGRGVWEAVQDSPTPLTVINHALDVIESRNKGA